MGEKDFQQEVIDRLARIETKQDAHAETVGEHSKVIASHSERITVTEQSAKSAHHRIDGIYATAGAIGGLVGGVVQFISSLWRGGHQ